MLVEMRLEDVVAPAAKIETQPEAAALRELITAGLVTHEAIGDPARLAGEAATLRAICSLVAGPVYRLEPFHYAFAVRAEDLGGMLARLAASARTTALQAALAVALGPEAIWIGATDLLPDDTETMPDAAETAVPDAPVMLLRAHAGAVTAALVAAGPGVQAVIDARYAVECARLTAGAETSTALGPRLGAIEAALEETRAALAAQAETTGLLVRLSHALNTVLKRLDVQSGVLHAHIAREDVVAERLADLSRIATAPGAFQETLGLTLAEFLAGMQRRAEDPPTPVHAPQAR